MPDLRNEFSCDWEGCGDDLDQNIWVFTVNDIRYVAFDPTPDGDASDALFVYQYTNDETESDANGIDQENWITWKYNGEPWIICLLYTSPSPRDPTSSRMPSSA